MAQPQGTSTVRTKAHLTGASVGTVGKEWDKFQECWLQRSAQKGFPFQLLPLSGQVTPALTSQGTDGSLTTCPLSSLGAAESTQGTGEAFQKHLSEITATGKATMSVEGCGGRGCRFGGQMG